MHVINYEFIEIYNICVKCFEVNILQTDDCDTCNTISFATIDSCLK
jgi:hypothetical protein